MMNDRISLMFSGKVWIFGDNISTDLMMPGNLYTRMLTFEEIAKSCMQANRPGWADSVEEGDIIVAGRNFGCGSSRPAVRVLKALGISIVVAESMSRLFFRNSVNVGFPALICPGISSAFHEGDIAEVNAESGIVKNITRNEILEIEPLAKDSPPYQILRAGGLDSFLKEKISEINDSFTT